MLKVRSKEASIKVTVIRSYCHIMQENQENQKRIYILNVSTVVNRESTYFKMYIVQQLTMWCVATTTAIVHLSFLCQQWFI